MIPIVFHPIYSQLTLPRNHRFPIEKYQALYDQAVLPRIDKFDVNFVDGPISHEPLMLVHSPDYVRDFINGDLSDKKMRRIGFPWSEQFVKRTLHAVAGTVMTAQLACEHDIAINLTGGYHHAHRDFGSGFCVFNDLMVAARHVIDTQLASRVLIFDCDVHQGDGTATCGQTSPDIMTVSIHCEKNFPARKQSSDLDVGLPKDISNPAYLDAVASTLDTAINAFKPDFIIYDAGVDIHEDDDLGLLNIDIKTVKARDLTVFSTAKHLGIPVMAVIGGGYQRDIDALTQVHMQMIDAALDVFFV